MPGDSLEADLLKIQALYQSHGYTISLGDMAQYSKIK